MSVPFPASEMILVAKMRNLSISSKLLIFIALFNVTSPAKQLGIREHSSTTFAPRFNVINAQFIKCKVLMTHITFI